MIDGLIIDSFAGGGGASTGIEMALDAAFREGLTRDRRFVDYAINHDREAITMHAANHPHTHHLPCNIWSVDWESLVNKRAVGLMWFSPDCKHFSKAKGGKPVKKNIRDLAWVVVKAARQVRPAVIMLENVEEFQTWGPLIFKRIGDGRSVGPINLFEPGARGDAAIPDDVVRDEETGEPVLVPDPARKGQTFREWTAALRRLGYRMEWRELRACDYGAPTIRKRFFMIARRDAKAIVWPKPTHGDPKSEAVKNGELKPWRTAAEIIDWSLPCHSIFLTREEGRAFGVKRPLETATMDRIAKGVDRYVIRCEKPFIVNLTHQGSDRVEDTEAPMNTVTGAHRGEKAVVSPVYVGVGGRAAQSAPRSGDMPLGTLTAKADGVIVTPTLLPSEEAVPTFEEWFENTKDLGGSPGEYNRIYDPDGPGPFDDSDDEPDGGYSAAPFTSFAQQGGRNRSADAPLHTATASPKDQNQVVTPLLVRTSHGERDKSGKKRGRGEHSADAPLPTVLASPEFGVVAPHLMTMRNAQKPHSAPNEPTHTITAGGAHLNLVSAFLAQHNIDGHTGEGNPGRTAEAPISTVTASGSQQGVVATHMLDMHGGDMRMAGADEPLRTLTAQGYHAAQVAAFLTKYYGTDQDPHITDPMHTVPTRDRFGLVTVMIGGEPWVIADIGMRMLTPRELFRAQGFPESYIIDCDFETTVIRKGGREVRVVKPLTKTAQIRMCGNSVCPQMAEALVRANLIDEVADFVRPANDPDRLGGLFGDVPFGADEVAA
jgi:DNA (cytosine-5)-methyltransferase 1